jgi:hypothetical protein
MTLILYHVQKLTQSALKALNLSSKTIKVLGEKKGGKFHNVRNINGFLDMTPKARR